MTAEKEDFKMDDLRFSYHPVKKVFLVSSDYDAHGDTIARYNQKAKSKLSFDEFIRGIIKDNVLYLRSFYPLPDIDERKGQEIKDYSFNALFDARKAILKAITEAGYNKPRKIVYNVINEDLHGIVVNI